MDQEPRPEWRRHDKRIRQAQLGQGSRGLLGYHRRRYSDVGSGDRIIDAQCAASTLYVDKTFQVFQTMFGVNFADGRIKGYPLCVSMQGLGESDFYVYYVRGNLAYGVNDFQDNGDGTITDSATGRMWLQAD